MEDFGFIIKEVENSNEVQFIEANKSSATYKNGKPRRWQGESEFTLPKVILTSSEKRKFKIKEDDNKIKLPIIGHKYKNKNIDSEEQFIVHEADKEIVGFFMSFDGAAALDCKKYSLKDFWNNFEEMEQIKLSPKNKFHPGQKVIYLCWDEKFKAHCISIEIIDSAGLYEDKVNYFVKGEHCNKIPESELFTQIEAMERLKEIVYENKKLKE